jgi:hypothetical protein
MGAFGALHRLLPCAASPVHSWESRHPGATQHLMHACARAGMLLHFLLVGCAERPPLDLAWMRQNTSVRHGVCTQVVKSTDPTMPSLVFVYGVPDRRSVELRSTTAHPAIPWEAFE